MISNHRRSAGHFTRRFFYLSDPLYNLQGDVVALLDENGDVAVEYLYDAWGQVLSITDNTGKNILETNASHIGWQNPFRYRGAAGYYYDSETGFYYLQSRYYDPEVGRFINADGYTSTGQLLGENMFAYCGNDPVNRVDPDGERSATYTVILNNGKTLKGCIIQDVRMLPNVKDYYIEQESLLPEIKPNMPQEDFVDAVYQRAKFDESKTKIPAAIMTAQACLESGYGSEEIATEKNNLFGIKNKDFSNKKYFTIEESILDYERIITTLPYYKDLFKLQSAEEWAYAIGPAGYTPDPGYGDALMSVMQR